MSKHILIHTFNYFYLGVKDNNLYQILFSNPPPPKLPTTPSPPNSLVNLLNIQIPYHSGIFVFS